MTQYIPKDALLAEIVKKIEKYTKRAEEADVKCDSDSMYWSGVISCLMEVTSLLHTIEVKKVDLDKEIKEYIDDEWCDEYSGDVGNWIRCRRGTSSMIVEDVKDIARHFFELGLKARKEEIK